MSQIENTDEFGELRAAHDYVQCHSIHVPAYDDATFVQKALPLANRLVTPEESVDAFLLTRYRQHLSTGSIIPSDTDELVSAQDEPSTSVLGNLVGVDDELGSTEGELVKQARDFRRSTAELRKEFRRALFLILNGKNVIP